MITSLLHHNTYMSFIDFQLILSLGSLQQSGLSFINSLKESLAKSTGLSKKNFTVWSRNHTVVSFLGLGAPSIKLALLTLNPLKQKQQTEPSDTGATSVTKKQNFTIVSPLLKSKEVCYEQQLCLGPARQCLHGRNEGVDVAALTALATK